MFFVGGRKCRGTYPRSCFVIMFVGSSKTADAKLAHPAAYQYVHLTKADLLFCGNYINELT